MEAPIFLGLSCFRVGDYSETIGDHSPETANQVCLRTSPQQWLVHCSIMKSTRFIVFLILIGSAALALASGTDGKPVRNIELTETRDIADAAAVNTAISVLFKDAESCPAAPLEDRQACGCSFKDDLKKLKSAYDAAVAKHPGWNEVDTVVAYRNAAKGTVILSFPGIERQLNACAQHQQ